MDLYAGNQLNGTATVNYTIQDQDGAQSTSTHDIVVAPNDPPVLTDPVPGDPATPEIDPRSQQPSRAGN